MNYVATEFLLLPIFLMTRILIIQQEWSLNLKNQLDRFQKSRNEWNNPFYIIQSEIRYCRDKALRVLSEKYTGCFTITKCLSDKNQRFSFILKNLNSNISRNTIIKEMIFKEFMHFKFFSCNCHNWASRTSIGFVKSIRKNGCLIVVAEVLS